MNKFQEDCVNKIRDLLKKINYKEEIVFNFTEGEDFNFYLVNINTKRGILKIYLYDDEIGFQLNDSAWNLIENAAYPQQDELIKAFITKLENRLKKYMQG